MAFYSEYNKITEAKNSSCFEKTVQKNSKRKNMKGTQANEKVTTSGYCT